MPRPRPLILTILDGWGFSPAVEGNAIAAARKPNYDKLLAEFPNTVIHTSGPYVGLPEGQMGNSEVGHLNIGAGRIIQMDVTRIDMMIALGEFFRNPVLLAAMHHARGRRLHLLGLCSQGGVHSQLTHLYALLRMAKQEGVAHVFVHAFMDGRDTPPESGADYLREMQHQMRTIGVGRIATVSGRYYAMDRDKRWERVEKAYRCLVDAEGRRAPDGAAAVRQGYDAGETDEFVLPTAVGDYAGMKDGDGVLMANFRADRVREILAALLDPGFDGFARPRVVRTAAALGMTEYSTALNAFVTTLFPPVDLSETFAEVVAEAGLTQLRIAETEKYAHVTFFFNGGRETEFPGETRILVPSPKVATYDLKPEMSAYEVTDKLVEAIDAGRFDVIVVNYANTDMVGHTGDLAAAIKAVEAVDRCLARLAEAVERAGGTMLVTADHGNAETMRDPETGERHTSHTLNPVPVLLVNPPAGITGLEDGRLADIAPTLLSLLGLPQPAAMTGHPLLLRTAPRRAEARASA
jgi:2,3-bisphosphoglycerate-independent phosphoglycerate mutase